MRGVDRNAIAGVLAVAVMVGVGLGPIACQTGGSREDAGVVTVGSAATDTGSGSTDKYQDPESVTSLNTANIESNDVIACAKFMVGRMLANPLINTSGGTPRVVIVDSKYFTVRTSTRLDKDLLIDRLRVELINAANGRIRFAGREYAAVVEEEKGLEEGGVVGKGTTPGSAHQLKADYRMVGRITELAENAGNRIQKYYLMTFEMVDTNTGEIVFSDKWEFKKQKTIPTAYR